MRIRFSFGDLVGAFADSAILFPLIALLSTKSGFNITLLFLTSGLAYFLSGWLFRIPMPVQPLKSIAIAAIAVGANMSEVRVSGGILGVSCLLLIFFRIERFSMHKDVIQSVQAGLGALLIAQGYKTAILSDADPIIIFAIAVLMILFDLKKNIPLLGITAAIGVVYALFKSTGNSTPFPLNEAQSVIRPWMVASLVLPQLALTSANSVLGTVAVARKYFGEQAKNVTVKNILLSIGLGNLIAAAVSGLPWCHGAGGLTAHYKGGARNFSMNLVIGLFLISLAAYSKFIDSVHLTLPSNLIGALLLSIGYFHFKLAEETWGSSKGKLMILISAGVALLTGNLFFSLAALVFTKTASKKLLNLD